MILGNSIFVGNGLKEQLLCVAGHEQGTTVFDYYVNDPERFGIVRLDKAGCVVSIEEKSEEPESNYCTAGPYFYSCRTVEFVKSLKPSARGEFEIIDLNRLYLGKNELEVSLLDQGFT